MSRAIKVKAAKTKKAQSDQTASLIDFYLCRIKYLESQLLQ